jgi:hypothetical protein
MMQIQEHLLAIFKDGMISASIDIDHGADAAGVVFIS